MWTPRGPRPCQGLEGELYVRDYTETLLAVVTVLGAAPSSAPPRQSRTNASLIESPAWETQVGVSGTGGERVGASATSGNSRASGTGGFLRRRGRFRGHGWAAALHRDLGPGQGRVQGWGRVPHRGKPAATALVEKAAKPSRLHTLISLFQNQRQ